MTKAELAEIIMHELEQEPGIDAQSLYRWAHGIVFKNLAGKILERLEEDEKRREDRDSWNWSLLNVPTCGGCYETRGCRIGEDQPVIAVYQGDNEWTLRDGPRHFTYNGPLFWRPIKEEK